MTFMTKGNKFSADRGPGRYRGGLVTSRAFDARTGEAIVIVENRQPRPVPDGMPTHPPLEIEVGPPIPDVPLPPKPAGAVGVQPWGVLPAKPPGRSR